VKRSTCIALLALSMPLTACVHVSRSVLSTAREAQPVPKEQVQVYLPGDPLPSHERIAILNTRTDAGSFAESELVEKLREEAGKLGANALVLDYLTIGQTGLVSGLSGEDPVRRSQALAIFVGESVGAGALNVPASSGSARLPDGPRPLVWPGRRVRFDSGGRRTGVVERTTPDSMSVLLAGGGELRTFAFSATQGLHVSEGRRSLFHGLRDGAAVGSVIGAATGLVVWLAEDDSCPEDGLLDPLCETAEGLLGAAVISAYGMTGVVLGGAVGALLSRRERWARVGSLAPTVTASGAPGFVWRGQLRF